MSRSLGQGMPFRISWGSLLAGTVASLGVLILLYALGMALGLSSVNPDKPDTIRASGIFTGVWGLMTPLVALFVGGMVAGRSAGATSRMGGVLHGMVVWSLTAVAGVWLLATMFGGMVGTAVSVGQNMAAGAITSADAPAETSGEGGVVADVKEKLDEVGAAAKQQIKEDAIEAAPETGVAMWVVFGALFLGFLSALAGGGAGVTREQRHMAEQGAGAVEIAAPITTPVAVDALPDSAVADLRQEIAELRGELHQMRQH